MASESLPVHYIGVDGLTRSSGYPVKEKSSARSHDAADAARLWDVSEELTGVRYGALAD